MSSIHTFWSVTFALSRFDKILHYKYAFATEKSGYNEKMQ